MLNVLILSIPMAFFWVVLSQETSLQGLLIGYVFGAAILQSIRLNTRFDDEDISLDPAKIPGQLAWLLLYAVRLMADVFFSGVDVARRVIQPDMPINPGEYCISTQEEYDDHPTPLISAMSAHSITITPGELVIDFDTCGEGTMLVHTLDREASNEARLIADQNRRLELIERILGRYE